jgi:hypothetical protein
MTNNFYLSELLETISSIWKVNSFKKKKLVYIKLIQDDGNGLIKNIQWTITYMQQQLIGDY